MQLFIIKMLKINKFENRFPKPKTGFQFSINIPNLKQRLLDVWATLHQKIIDYFVNLNFGR